MARQTVLLAAAAAAATVALPASASIIVLGNSAARSCYEAAADLGGLPSRDAMTRCDDALEQSNLDQHDLVATHVNRGILRMRRGNADEALADFEAAIAINPSHPEAYLNRGSLMLRRDAAADAATMFTRAIERNTRRPELAYFGRGIANETLGNVRAAYSDYRRASELQPEWAPPREELTRFRVTR